MDTPQPVIDQREVVQQQWLNTLNEMNKYVNMALDMGRAEGKYSVEKSKVMYAIAVIENMLNSCNTAQETLENLRAFIARNGEDDSPF